MTVAAGDSSEVLFDLAVAAYEPSWFALLIGIVGTIGLIGFVISRRQATERLFAMGVAIVFFCITASTNWEHWREYVALREAIDRGAYTVVEGRVTNFRRDPPGGNEPQSFAVNGRRFLVRGASVTAAFHDTVSRGGPDLSDKCVRIAFVEWHRDVEPKIIRLEVRPCSDGDG